MVTWIEGLACEKWDNDPISTIITSARTIDTFKLTSDCIGLRNPTDIIEWKFYNKFTWSTLDGGSTSNKFKGGKGTNFIRTPNIRI